MAQQKQHVQLSIFDRLLEDSEFNALGGSVSDIHVVRNAVLRDVENLLNTRRTIYKPPESYTYLKQSLFVYGLEDFVAKNPKNIQVRKVLKASIQDTLTKFEPRLRDVSVEMKEDDGISRNLCFIIRAILYADPIQEPICFDTWFSVSRGEYKIRDHQKSVQ
jgi:type VI secretion system protein ImpF